MIASLLFASATCPCRVVAQDALPAPIGIDATAIPVDASFGSESAQDAPLPQAEGSEPSATAIPIGSESERSATSLKSILRVDSRLTYDDNIFINRRNRQSDLIFALSPTIAVGIGDVRPEFRRLALDTFSPAVVDEAYDPRSFIFASYTPTVTVFFDHDEEDALDHDAAVNAQWEQAYLTLGSETRFQTLSDPDIDVGGRVRRSIFSQDFTALYDYSDRTSFEFRLRGTIRHYPAQVDSQELALQDSINYRLGARTTIGLGLTLGWLHVEDSGDQPYGQILFRGSYHLSEKIDINGNAGIEFRELEQTDDRLEPVFQVGVRYRPWDQTQLALGFARRIENSAGSPGFDVISTEVAFDARQRFAGSYYVGLVGRYLFAQYLSVLNDQPARRDNVLLIQPYLRIDLSKSAALELGYAFRNDDSNVDRFTFSQNRMYLQFDALF